MAKHVIEVTAEDIRHAVELAEERDAGDGPPLDVSCPIALAAMRALRKERVQTVSFDLDSPTTWSLDVWETADGARGGKAFTLPQEAVDFIERFDDGRIVQPFSFTVEERA